MLHLAWWVTKFLFHCRFLGIHKTTAEMNISGDFGRIIIIQLGLS